MTGQRWGTDGAEPDVAHQTHATTKPAQEKEGRDSCHLYTNSDARGLALQLASKNIEQTKQDRERDGEKGKYLA